MVKANERQLLDELEDTQVEIQHQGQFYDEYMAKIDREMEIVLNETQLNFEEQIEPMQKDFDQYEYEIETCKDQILQMKTNFERLRIELGQDALYVEKSTIDQVTIDHAMKMKQIDEEIKQTMRFNEDLKTRYETGSVMAEKMTQKLEVSRKNLAQAEEILLKGLESANYSSQRQEEEYEDLFNMRNNAYQTLENKLQDLEQLQATLQQTSKDQYNLETMAREDQLGIQNSMQEVMQQGEKRMIDLDNALQKYVTETQKMKERNSSLISEIEDGLQKVIQANLVY